MSDFPIIPTADDEDPLVSVTVDDKHLQASANIPFNRRNAPLVRPFLPNAGTPQQSSDSDRTPQGQKAPSTANPDDKPRNDPAGAPTTTPDGKPAPKTDDKAAGTPNGAPSTSHAPTSSHDATPANHSPKNNDVIGNINKDVNKALAGTPLDPKNLKNLNLDTSALTSLPLTMLTAGISTLSPIASMIATLIMARNQFGNGTPSTDNSNYPTTLGNNLNANTGNATTWDGSGKDAFSTDNNSKKRKDSAVKQIDSDLKKLLKKSGEESRIGRAKVQTILDTVNQQLTALQPISNTAAGQAQIVSILTSAITSAGGIVSQGVNQSGINAGDVRTLAGQYVSNTQATPSLTPTSADDTGSSKSTTSVDKDIDYALDAHGITDPAARARWKAGYRVLVGRESGGNTRASGDNGEAQGLTQTHWGTFQAYHVAGTPNDIHNGGANIAASMAYVMDRYDVDKSGVNLATNVQQADPSRSPKGY